MLRESNKGRIWTLLQGGCAPLTKCCGGVAHASPSKQRESLCSEQRIATDYHSQAAVYGAARDSFQLLMRLHQGAHAVKPTVIVFFDEQQR